MGKGRGGGGGRAATLRSEVRACSNRVVNAWV